jgi:hypothetical protein
MGSTKTSCSPQKKAMGVVGLELWLYYYNIYIYATGSTIVGLELLFASCCQETSSELAVTTVWPEHLEKNATRWCPIVSQVGL